MKLAWFRPAGRLPPQGDYLADVLAGLGRLHDVATIAERDAHDFVWEYGRGRFDLCVFELDNTAGHQYMWPYLLHYPGVLALQSATVHDARRARLVHEARLADYAAEIAFAGGPTHVRPPWHMARGQWPMLRVPVTASRLTAVADPLVAQTIEDTIPGAVVRLVDVGVADPGVRAPGPRDPRAELVVAITEPERRAVVERAVARVRGQGQAVRTQAAIEGDHGLADVVVALRWPLHGHPLVSGLQALASGRPLVVADVHGTALWPTLDPQTWKRRDERRPDAAIAIAIDPRDEEHSLVLALGRLANDPSLREHLGAAGRAWWANCATVEGAVTRWHEVLTEAVATAPRARPSDWPPHLDADSTSRLMSIWRDCGLTSPAL